MEHAKNEPQPRHHRSRQNADASSCLGTHRIQQRSRPAASCCHFSHVLSEVELRELAADLALGDHLLIASNAMAGFRELADPLVEGNL